MISKDGTFITSQASTPIYKNYNAKNYIGIKNHGHSNL